MVTEITTAHTGVSLQNSDGLVLREHLPENPGRELFQYAALERMKEDV
jgi:hypothetical protein